MRKSLSAACLALVLLSACSEESEKKRAETPAPTTPAPTAPPPAPAPTATPTPAPDAAAVAAADAGTAAATPDAGARDAGAAVEPSGSGPAEIETPNIKISTAKADITKGEEIFAAKGCVTCHRMGMRLVGPDLKGVTQRREQEWIEKMILRPDVMLQKDPLTKKLLTQFFTPMPNQNVDPKTELPFILAYLKANE
jgi:hypothetical protein